MDQHLGPGAVVLPQAASLHAVVVEFRVGHLEVFADRVGAGVGDLIFLQMEQLGPS